MYDNSGENEYYNYYIFMLNNERLTIHDHFTY